jgi:hypothetical protein
MPMARRAKILSVFDTIGAYDLDGPTKIAARLLYGARQNSIE